MLLQTWLLVKMDPVWSKRCARPLLVGFAWTFVACLVLPCIWVLLFMLGTMMGWIGFHPFPDEGEYGAYEVFIHTMEQWMGWVMFGPLRLVCWLGGEEVRKLDEFWLGLGAWLAVIFVAGYAWLGGRWLWRKVVRWGSKRGIVEKT